MKKGWESARIEELTDVVTKGTTPTSVGHKFTDTGINFIKVESINENGEFIPSKIAHISNECHDALRRSQIREGDILFSIAGALGRTAVAVPEVLPANTNQALSIIRLKDDAPALRRFVTYALSSGEITDQIEASRGGVAQQNLSLGQIKSFSIPLPPLEEQKRIVAVLDEAFEGLARARANAVANLQNAQELFDSHLTNILSHPGEGWKPATLGSLCKRITVGHVGPMANRYIDSGVPFLRSQNVRPFRIDLSDVKFIDDAFMSKLTKSELRPGDVAIVRTGYPGTCAVIPEDLELANCADLVIARPGPALNPHFLEMLLNSSYGKAHVAGASVGAAQKHFNVGAAKSASFPIPPLKVQDALVERSATLRGYSEDIAKIILSKLNNLDQLKQSLLQKAFAGELT